MCNLTVFLRSGSIRESWIRSRCKSEMQRSAVITAVFVAALVILALINYGFLGRAPALGLDNRGDQAHDSISADSGSAGVAHPMHDTSSAVSVPSPPCTSSTSSTLHQTTTPGRQQQRPGCTRLPCGRQQHCRSRQRDPAGQAASHQVHPGGNG